MLLIAGQMKRVLPEYSIADVPPDHPIRRTLYTIAELPQITNINLWRRYGGDTRERGWDSPHANFRMIADQSNRIMVLMTHNTDIADSWERETEEREFFLRFAPGATGSDALALDLPRKLLDGTVGARPVGVDLMEAAEHL